jgi:hypothetical protein
LTATFFMSLLLLAGAVGLVICLWNWIRKKRPGKMLVICLVLCVCAVGAGIWYYWPYEVQLETSQWKDPEITVTYYYAGSRAAEFSLDAEETETFCRQVDTLRVQRARLWSQGERMKYIRIYFHDAEYSYQAYVTLQLDHLKQSKIRYTLWQEEKGGYTDFNVSYTLCDPEPILEFLTPLLDAKTGGRFSQGQ